MNTQISTRHHATAIALEGKAVVFIGPSGSGKSSLALQLIALGAALVADDQCVFRSEGDALWVARPATLPERIEARGVGLLQVPMSGPAKVHLVVDMETHCNDRLPAERHIDILGYQIKVIDNTDMTHFPSAILLYLKYKTEL